jgi:hypothetical protein
MLWQWTRNQTMSIPKYPKTGLKISSQHKNLLGKHPRRACVSHEQWPDVHKNVVIPVRVTRHCHRATQQSGWHSVFIFGSNRITTRTSKTHFLAWLQHELHFCISYFRFQMLFTTFIFSPTNQHRRYKHVPDAEDLVPAITDYLCIF